MAFCSGKRLPRLIFPFVWEQKSFVRLFWGRLDYLADWCCSGPVSAKVTELI
jgi:hypothetical protein